MLLPTPTILSARTTASFSHVYIDAFAGSGQHVSRATGEFVPGSPLNALAVEPQVQGVLSYRYRL